MNQRIHFIGIEAQAWVLCEDFSGDGWSKCSDLKNSETTQYLQRLGARIALGHKAEHIDGADHVVYSSAIPKTILNI